MQDRSWQHVVHFHCNMMPINAIGWGQYSQVRTRSRALLQFSRGQYHLHFTGRHRPQWWCTGAWLKTCFRAAGARCDRIVHYAAAVVIQRSQVAMHCTAVIAISAAAKWQCWQWRTVLDHASPYRATLLPTAPSALRALGSGAQVCNADRWLSVHHLS
jgi:hypothetical protein